MTTLQASYAPGGWVAVSAPHTWLLVELPPGDTLVNRCWALLSAGRGVDELLEALISSGVRAMPSFAIVHLGDDEHRIVVRGTATVSGSLGERDVVALTGPPNAPWTDELLDGEIRQMELIGADTADGVQLPMSAGVTMAARILVTTDAAPVTEEPHPHVTPGPLGLQGSDALSETENTLDSGVADSQTGAHREADATPLPESIENAPVPLSEPETLDPPSYDFLFGATQRPPDLEPDQAAVDETELPRETTPTPEGPSLSETAGWNTMAGLGVVDALPAADATGSPASASLIDNVPWEAPAVAANASTPRWSPPPVAAPITWRPPQPTAAPEPQPQAPDPASADLAAHTIDRAALRAAMAEAPTVAGGPTVLAGRCAAGHLSPAHAASCRVCGQPMPEQQAFEIPRPALGILRLSTGDVVTLDRGVLLGRAPSEPANLEERPHLVRLASPENDISRNHAEIVIDGWHVFVRDLGSTNGTTVALPGQQPVRLRQNDLQLLERGAVVTLADEVSATFEVTG